MKVGFVGLGEMGRGMAQCVNRTHTLTVYNRTAAKAEDLVAQGATFVPTIDGLGDCDVVCSMLSDDKAVADVFLTDGRLVDWLRPGMTHISCSTISPGVVARLAQAHEQASVGFLCAPVLGRPDKASAGQLVSIIAGPKDLADQCGSIFEATSRGRYWMGAEQPLAAMAKIAVNFFVALSLEGLAEGFTLARKAGIAAQDFLPLLTETIFDCQVFQAYAPLVASEANPTPGFKTTLGLKDINLARSEAGGLGVTLPLADVISEQIQAAIDDGYGDEDWSTLARFHARRAGLPPLTS